MKALLQVFKPLLFLLVLGTPLVAPTHAADYYLAPPPVGDDRIGSWFSGSHFHARLWGAWRPPS